MFDTHAHLNFHAFEKNVNDIVKQAFDQGVTNIVIPGTDIPTSEKAIELATSTPSLYAAVGIHPHHVMDVHRRSQNGEEFDIDLTLGKIKKLSMDPRVVAIGEIGIDRHIYDMSKYESYQVDELFIDLQKIFLTKQIHIALEQKKSIIFHNREAQKDLLSILQTNWDNRMRKKAVLHCCESNEELLEFAKEHDFFIGVDGDITYDKKKSAFIEEVPLDMLVLETDSPFLTPEPLRSQKVRPNKPEYLKYIAGKVAKIKNISFEIVTRQTEENGKILFGI